MRAGAQAREAPRSDGLCSLERPGGLDGRAGPYAPVLRGGLPIGVRFVAAPWREDLLFRAARALERAGVAAPKPPQR